MAKQPEITHEELLDRAEGLVPRLRERAQETERLRRLHEDTVRELREARLLDLFRPRHHGGPQASLRTLFEVVTRLARGCGSTAWVVSQLNQAIWLLCGFPGAVGKEILDQPQSALIWPLYGRGAARRVQGGYVVSGVWPFCSGSHHVTWVGASLPLEDGSGGAVPSYFLIPASEMEILDDWHVSGLAGTCSNSTSAKEVFVPEGRVAPAATLFSGAHIPPDLTGTPYRCPIMQGVLLTAAAPALGLAQAALSEFKAQAPGKGISYTFYDKKAEAPVTHLLLAEAAMKVRSADLLLHAALDDLERRAGDPAVVTDVEFLLRIRLDATYAAHLCREAVDILFGASGGSSLVLSNPMQRIARDVRALCQHAAYNLHTNYEAYGRVMLGLSPNLPFV